MKRWDFITVPNQRGPPINQLSSFNEMLFQRPFQMLSSNLLP